MNDIDFDAKKRPVEVNDERRKSRLTMLWILIVIALAVIAALIIIIIGKDSNGPNIVKEGAQSASYTATLTKGNNDSSQLSYGTWTGELRYGQPHGQGTLKYTEQRLISQFDPKGTVAHPGDYVIGEFDSGQLISGRLYRVDGSTVDIATGISPGSTQQQQ